MGGYGSGRWGRRLGARLLTTQCLSVDVRLLAREGALVPGATFTLEYRQGRALRGTVTPGMVTSQVPCWNPTPFRGGRMSARARTATFDPSSPVATFPRPAERIEVERLWRKE
jgi:hypothetical protein